MSNRKHKRYKNFNTARKLGASKEGLRPRLVGLKCPECGAAGDTCWISSAGFGLLPPGPGFWTCDKFYGPTGRRDESVQPNLAVHPNS